MTEDEKREALAAFIHDMWSAWMLYLFENTIVFGNLYTVLDGEKEARWRRQMVTDYYDLPESEKQSDRELADKLRKHLEDNE